MADQNESAGPKDPDQGGEKAPNIFERVESHIQSRTLQGFVALIPLLVTVLVLAFIISYADGFIRDGPDVAPLTMPRRPGVFEFPGMAGETFRGLPGLLADSLPDRFGRSILDAWLQRRGRSASPPGMAT